MKPLPTLLLVACGLAAGWMLPPLPSTAPGETARGHGRTATDRTRTIRKRELLSAMLDEEDLATHKFKNATSLSGMLAALRGAHDIDESEAARIVDKDPASALDTLLADPAASHQVCLRIAAEWSRRDPGHALRYLRAHPSFRAADCLDEVLLAAYPSHPGLVADVIRSKSKAWQERHLEELFTASWNVRAANAPPEALSDDPFADDGFWVTQSVGRDLLACLANDALRAQALGYLTEDSSEPAGADPRPDAPSKPLDVATLDLNDWTQRDFLREQIAENPAITIAEIAERGSFATRAAAMDHLMGRFPMDSKSWPTALEEVEHWIAQLDVIPEHPPSHFEMGPFLRGEVAAGWIDRQPLALQRAWGPAFSETWAQSDPRAAVDWARTLPEAAARDQAIQSGMIVWAHREPLAASAYVDSLPPGDVRESAISNTAAAWACIDRSGAASWLANLPDSPGKTRALERLK